MRVLALVVACLIWCSACATDTPPAQPTVPPETTPLTSAPTVPPTAAPLTPMPAPVLPSPAAVDSSLLPGPAHPAWIALRHVGEPVDGTSSISLIDADTGQMVESVCGSGDGDPFAWSPDGSWLACVRSHFGRFITLVSAADPTQQLEWSLPPKDPSQLEELFLAWSPRAPILAVSIGTHIYQIVPDPATPPQVLKVCRDVPCSAIAWSPDGTRLATNDARGLSLLDPASGGETSVTDEGIFLSGSTAAARDVRVPLQNVAFSPDGTQIAYTGLGGSFIVPTAGGDTRRLVQPQPFPGIMELAWSADGRAIEFISPNGHLVRAGVDEADVPYGDMVEQFPLALRSTPERCTVTLAQTGSMPIGWPPGAEPSPEGPIYDLFLSFTQSDAVVRLTDSGVYGPLILREGETPKSSVSVRRHAAWAPGLVRAPTLTLADPPQRGCAIIELQTWLEARGFAPGPVDGIYGPATAAAVQAFQQANGLAVDGVVGSETWVALGGWLWDR